MKRSLIALGAALALATGVTTAQVASQASGATAAQAASQASGATAAQAASQAVRPAALLAQAAATNKAGDKAPATARIDINSAKADELQTLKGIGPARADAIIAGRPYSGKDDLVRRKIVPQSVYDEIKDEIIARQK